jgi:hypothetical protein
MAETGRASFPDNWNLHSAQSISWVTVSSCWKHLLSFSDSAQLRFRFVVPKLLAAITSKRTCLVTTSLDSMAVCRSLDLHVQLYWLRCRERCSSGEAILHSRIHRTHSAIELLPLVLDAQWPLQINRSPGADAINAFLDSGPWRLRLSKYTGRS